jgi:hypothetical protein
MRQWIMNDETSRDYAIRLSAYHSWEAAGRPPGYELDFWLSATKSLTSSFPNSAREVRPLPFGYEGGVSAQPPLVRDSVGAAGL